MRKTMLSVSGLVLLLLALPSVLRANACPNVGFLAGCDTTVTLSPGGTSSTVVNSTQPYDGVDDQMIGVVNNTGDVVTSINLSGTGIFGFDGDGAGGGNDGTLSCTNGLGLGFGISGASNVYGCPFAGFGATGYEGPNTSFSVVNPDNGTVFFTGGLAQGATAWFSLEQAPALQGVNFTVTGVAGVPEPSSMLLLGSGLVSLLGFARHRLAI